MKMRLLVCPLCIISLFLYVSAKEGQMIIYNAANFYAEVPKQNHFILFYAPWCTASKHFTQTWNELAGMLNKNGTNVKIAKVDCEANNDICSDSHITRVPSLKFYKLGASAGVFTKGENVTMLIKYLTQQLGQVKLTESKTTEQDPDNDDANEHLEKMYL